MKKRIWIPVVLALALAAMGFAGFVGFEALKTAQAAALPAATAPTEVLHGGIGENSQYLADALGITLDELTAANKAAYTAAIDQALADGLITQAQADSLKERLDVGNGIGGRGKGMFFSLEGIDFDSLLAKELGISVDDLNAARAKAQGAAIDAAVEAGRITQEQADLMKGQLALSSDSTFITAMKNAFSTAIEQAVKSGVITQAQADALLNRLNTGGSNFMGRSGMDGFHGRGFMGGMDEFHGFGPGGWQHGRGSDITPPSSESTTTPSTSL